MAKEERKAGVEQVAPDRVLVDWQYLLFYIGFYICLIFIALFGLIAEA